jgi:hypothetical protein
MIPPIQFVAGLLKSLVAYKLTRRKSVFLLPYQFAFKMTAWCLGFIKAQIERTRKTKNSERSLDTWQRIV